MDERNLEVAEELTKRMQESAVAACVRQAFPDQNLKPSEYKTRECLDCGDDLPKFRMQKGLELCVPCQEAKDARKRR